MSTLEELQALPGDIVLWKNEAEYEVLPDLALKNSFGHKFPFGKHWETESKFSIKRRKFFPLLPLENWL